MEFMLLIKTEYKSLYELSPNEMQLCLEKNGRFIGQLVAEGKMEGGGALDRSGILVERSYNAFVESPLDDQQEELMSYLRIKAKDLTEAVEIAKSDPGFDQPGWKIEVRPVLTNS